MPTGVSGGRTWRGYWQWMMSGRSSTRSRASSAATATRSSRQRTRRRSRGRTGRASTSCSATMMPGSTALSSCRQIRPDFDGPIIFLTARVAEEDAVAGYGLGADDYVRKPFGAAELRAKVAAHQRRERRPRSHRPLLRGGADRPRGARPRRGRRGRAAHAHRVRHLRVPRPPPRAGHEPRADPRGGARLGERRRRRGHIHAGQPRPEELSEAGADPIATVWGMGYKWQL